MMSDIIWYTYEELEDEIIIEEHISDEYNLDIERF